MTTPTPRTDAVVEQYRESSTLIAHNRMLDLARQLERDLAAAQSELDKLKAHAEAMANGVEGKVYYADAPDVCEAVDAYRADFPKDAP